MKWFIEKVAPDLAKAAIISIATLLALFLGSYFVAQLSGLTQLWAPDGAYIMVSKEDGCPSGNWKSTGRVLIQVHEDDRRFYPEGTYNFDNKGSNWPSFNSLELWMCRKVGQ